MRSLRPGRGVRQRLRPAAAIFLAALVAACAGGQAAGTPKPDPQKDKLAQIETRGVLNGYAAIDYPPQSMLVEGATRPADTKCLPTQKTGAEVTGFDNETTKLVAKDLGVEACFVTPTWTEVTAGGWSDRWDIVYGSGSIDRDRMKRLYMTQPYYATPNMFFVRADSPFKTADELSGKKVGACASCSRVLPEARTRHPGRHARVRHRGPEDRRLRDRGPRAPGSRRRQDRRLPRRRAGRPGTDRRRAGPAGARQAGVHVLPLGLRRQELGPRRRRVHRPGQSDHPYPPGRRDPEGAQPAVLRTRLRREGRGVRPVDHRPDDPLRGASLHRSIARPASLVAIVALLAAACAGPGGSSAPASAALDPAKDKLAQVIARGTLVLSTDPVYPPQSFAVEGADPAGDTKCAANQLTGPEIDGYDAETGKPVAAALGVEPCFVTPPLNEVIAGGWGDRWDVAWGSGAITARG